MHFKHIAFCQIVLTLHTLIILPKYTEWRSWFLLLLFPHAFNYYAPSLRCIFTFPLSWKRRASFEDDFVCSHFLFYSSFFCISRVHLIFSPCLNPLFQCGYGRCFLFPCHLDVMWINTKGSLSAFFSAYWNELGANFGSSCM